jgi:hypothetical protein
MRKRLIVLVLCAVLVSAGSITFVVSAHPVGSNTVKQSGIFFIIAALYKFWQSKINPVLRLFSHEDNLGSGTCYYDLRTGERICD